MSELIIGIVILNYNSLYETKQLINSIRKYESRISLYIVLVDNNSNDSEMLSKDSLNIDEIILLKENNGYAAGNNIGIKKAIQHGCEYIVVANSDTEVIEDDTIYKLIVKMKENNALIIGPCIVDSELRTTSGAGVVNRFGKVKEKKYNKPNWCQSIIGAFFVINKKVIEEIGYISENYFLYLEETDFFLRAYNKGFRTLYYPTIKVLHYGGTTTSKVYDYYISRNRFLLAEQNFNTPHVIMTLYLYVEFFITDVIQSIACKVGIRKYDAKFRRKKRWMGYVDGKKRIFGKKEIESS